MGVAIPPEYSLHKVVPAYPVLHVWWHLKCLFTGGRVWRLLSVLYPWYLLVILCVYSVCGVYARLCLSAVSRQCRQVVLGISLLIEGADYL